MARKSNRSSKRVAEVSRIKRILTKIIGRKNRIEIKGEIILLDFALIKSGKQGLDISFSSDATSTIVALITNELSERYTLNIGLPYYQAADGTLHVGPESERAYRKDLEDYFKNKFLEDARMEKVLQEYESDILN